MRSYLRPLVQTGPARPADALNLAGGWGWFTHVELLSRTENVQIVPATELSSVDRKRLTDPRPDIVGLSMECPRIMGILNTTPDSFSDGGQHVALGDAIKAGQSMQAAGADIIDVGGESTRPGAQTVATEEEINRTAPVISGLPGAGVSLPISIDTRKVEVAAAAAAAGADMVNDISAGTYDAALMPFCSEHNLPVCVMHAQGDPATMQQNPRYDDVLLDVYDYLDDRIAALEEIGIDRGRIIADPGIGFGKTQAHNLQLLARLSLFHSLGVPILLGASRKRFIGTIGNAPAAGDRAPGSIAVALVALSHGVQVLRVHDVSETVQAVALWRAAIEGRTT